MTKQFKGMKTKQTLQTMLLLLSMICIVAYTPDGSTIPFSIHLWEEE